MGDYLRPVLLLGLGISFYLGAGTNCAPAQSSIASIPAKYVGKWAGVAGLGWSNTSDLVATRKGVNVDRAVMLVDLTRKAVLWSYICGTQDNVTFGQKTFDGRFWLVGSTAKGKAGQVTAIALFHERVRRTFPRQLGAVLDADIY